MSAWWLASVLFAAPADPTVITRLPTHERVVALTFDACEATTVVHLDERILEVLDTHPVPFTVFASGKFVRDNAAAVQRLAQRPGVTVENHSWDHPRDMRRLDDAAVIAEVAAADAVIERVTGRRPALFRFPGGNVDDHVAAVVAATDHRIVHWRWAEGDPDAAISADALVAQTLERTRPGDILILHINGRGVHTADALPRILDGLTARGYRFVSVDSALRAAAP